MRKLTWKEAFRFSWWIPLIFLAFTWTISLVIGDLAKDALIISAILSSIITSLWFFAFVNHAKATTLKCICRVNFPSLAKNCPSCNLGVPKELQK
jgi:hypothetical protein